MRLTRRTLDQRSSPIGAHVPLLDHVPADLELIDLSQGAPSFPPPEVIADHVAEVARRADGARYTPLFGLPELRSALAVELSDAYDADIGADHVCITAGANQAFAAVVSALAEPGDNVALVLPYYFNHDMWLGLEGIEPRYVEPASGVLPTPDEVVGKIDDRTRAVTLVTPGNPTGAAFGAAELDAIVEAVSERGVPIILDETYRSFLPADGPPHGQFSVAGWTDRIVSLHSFSKDFAMPGWRVGAIVAAPALLDEIAKVVDCVTICPSRLGQEAAIAALAHAQPWRADKVTDIGRRQARFEEVLESEPGGFQLLSAGAYYGWVRHPFPEISSDAVAEALLLEAAVVTISGTAFAPTDPQAVRCSFANATLEQLDELPARLERAARALREC